MVKTSPKLLNLTSEDFFKILAEKIENILPSNSSTSLEQLLDCCFYANAIPEWIWNEISEERKEEFKTPPKNDFDDPNDPIEKDEYYKKNFIRKCTKNEYYKVVKDICNASKHATFFKYAPITQNVEYRVNIDPEVQHFMQTGKKLEKDQNGDYCIDYIPVDMDNAIETFVRYKDSRNKPKIIVFRKLISECYQYLIDLREKYLNMNSNLI